MTELNINGMILSKSVIESIVSLAATSVEGVYSVGDPTTSGIRAFLGLAKPTTGGIEIECGDNNDLSIELHIWVLSGIVLPDLAQSIRLSVADAINTQIGLEVESVDIYIDGIHFIH